MTEYIEGPRRSGKTTRMIQAVNEAARNGERPVLVVRDSREVSRVRSQYGLGAEVLVVAAVVLDHPGLAPTTTTDRPIYVDGGDLLSFKATEHLLRRARRLVVVP